jgi:phage baseplate assembly protein W
MADKSLYNNTVISNNKPASAAPPSRAYRGISTVSSPVNGFSLYDVNLIKQDLINHFHIRQGEKLENPTFGTIIWDLLFDPLTEEIKEAIRKNVTDIVNYDPRVRIDGIAVAAYESGIQIDCTLTYLPYNISEQLRFKFDQDNGIMQ